MRGCRSSKEYIFCSESAMSFISLKLQFDTNALLRERWEAKIDVIR